MKEEGDQMHGSVQQMLGMMRKMKEEGDQMHGSVQQMLGMMRMIWPHHHSFELNPNRDIFKIFRLRFA